MKSKVQSPKFEGRSELELRMWRNLPGLRLARSGRGGGHPSSIMTLDGNIPSDHWLRNGTSTS